MSRLVGPNGVTGKDDNNSSGEENSSDAEYELQEIRPHISGSRSSLSRRPRKRCCSMSCCGDWTILTIAYAIFYVINGIFTLALIEAMLSNPFNTLVVFGCIWVVFMIIFLYLVITMSEKKRIERERLAREILEEEVNRRKEIKAALERNN